MPAKKRAVAQPLGPVKHGAVIVFSDDLTKIRAQMCLQMLVDKGWVEFSSGVKEYQPEHGEPAWYIP